MKKLVIISFFILIFVLSSWGFSVIWTKETQEVKSQKVEVREVIVEKIVEKPVTVNLKPLEAKISMLEARIIQLEKKLVEKPVENSSLETRINSFFKCVARESPVSDVNVSSNWNGCRQGYGFK